MGIMEINEIVEKVKKEVFEHRDTILEDFCKAYLAETWKKGLIKDLVLVEQHSKDFSEIFWYFAKRKNIKEKEVWYQVPDDLKEVK